MQSGKSRQEILDRINKVNRTRVDHFENDDFQNDEIFHPVFPDAISCFKSEIELVNGQCFVFKNEKEAFAYMSVLLEEKGIDAVYCRDTQLLDLLLNSKIKFLNTPDDFEKMQAGCTFCECLVARTGSVVVSSAQASGRQMNVFPPIHIVIAYTNQLVEFPEDALHFIGEKYKENLPSAVSTITGPSRTADIEKTLVLGAHGPKELIVILIKV